MKREIKFRAWDGTRMYEWDLDYNTKEGIFRFLSYEETENSFVTHVRNWGDRDINIMQWTGFTDRHDYDIYEGDIVEHDNGFDVVMFNEDCLLPMGGLHVIAQNFLKYCEIRGNIYENPELLKNERINTSS